MKYFIFFCFLVIAFGCQQPGKIPENFDYGKVENGIYKNEYFHFQVGVPASWVVQNKEQTDRMMKEGRKFYKENNEEKGKMIKASEISSAVLLTVFKNKTDTITGEFNPSFMILAENLGSGSGVSSGKDYLKRLKEAMSKSTISYTFPPDFQFDEIGNKKFDVMPVSANVSGLSVTQVYYATIEKNFALTIITSFAGDEQKEQVRNIIDKIRFE